MDWDQGYIVDTPYTYGYYSELGPVKADFALLASGHAPIPQGPCCELGFGHGVSLCVNAAAGGSRRWWGNDFNPTHVRYARSLAEAAGLDITLSDESFAQFCARDDLPEFAFIALHGVWSWIPPADQQRIVEFVARRLMVGGVLYVSYNTLPGWAPMMPVRELFGEYARSACSPALDSLARMKEALAFVGRLLAAEPPFAQRNPSVARRLERMRENPTEYLPHEYLTADWCAPTFSQMARALGAAKLSYAGPAALTDRIDALHLTEDQRKLVAEIPDPALRETTRDFLINQQFRRDYWVKGESRLKPSAQREMLFARPLVLSLPPSQAPKTVAGGRGELTLQPEVYDPLLEALHAADGPFVLGDLVREMGRAHSIAQGKVTQAVAMLVGNGVLHPVQPDARAQESADAARRLNARLIEGAAVDGRTEVLASPLTGGGVRVSVVDQLILLGRSRGLDDESRLADFAWRALQSQGVRLIVEGKSLETNRENIDELARRAREYDATLAPIHRRLRIA